jgi:dihydroxyacetone kinase-like protein
MGEMRDSMETLNKRLDTENLRRWVLDFAHQILDEHEALSDLDAASGDADHGSNMHRGMSSLLRVIPEWNEEALPAEFLKDVGMHLVSSVGGSSGALYGTIFLRMARTIGGAGTVDAQLLVRAFEAAGDGVAERGKVKQGDKTMYDALAPAIHALREQVEAGEESLAAALGAAAAAAEAGRDATADMVARKGKSSYARENSRGVIDPGAASAAMLVRSAARALL